MTDNQQRLFQRMLEGKIRKLEDLADWFLDDVDGTDNSTIISKKFNKEWDDYVTAWKAYKNVPLIKALE